MANRVLHIGDKLRASWSEEFKTKSGHKVYVSTAIETAATSTSVIDEVGRLTDLMETAHVRNIAAATNDE